ncbi:MAG TPA: DUF58 domain-containing protein [Trichocoleus sp.]|jgi:uncharacterized protein (DUF58 family)
MVPAGRVYWGLLLGLVGSLGIAIGGDSFSSAALEVALGLLLLWDGGLLMAMVWDGRQARANPVRVTRQLAARLSIGRENGVTLRVETGDRSATVQIRDFYPLEFEAQPEMLFVTLPPHAQQDLTYTVLPRQRGKYTWSKIQVRQRGAWGLAWSEQFITQAQTIAVYPDLLGLRSLSVRLTLQMAGNLRRIQRSGTGTEFAELREYSTGDDPRLIDWKATARRSRLLLRVLEPEQEQTLIILLDRGRLMTAQVRGLARFDWGLNAALALALAGLHRGDRVGIGVFDRQMHLWIPPERGQRQLPRLIEQVTPIQPVLQEPDYLGAVSTVTRQQTRRALVVLLTDIIDKTASAELLGAMGHLAPRYLPFCVTLRDPQVDRQAQTFTPEVDSTYSRAVALDLLAQRQVAFSSLKQKGVLVLDAPAHQVTESLVDRYLQLKARSLL